MTEKRSIKIRVATTDDAAMLSKIGWKSFYDAFADHPRNKPEDMKAYMDQAFSVETIAVDLADPTVTYLIGEIDDQIVGYAKIKAKSTEPCVTGTNPIELCRLYALQDWIGHGVGPSLMQACLDEAQKRGYDTMWLGVWEFNYRAQKFYSKWGFEKIGEHVFQLGSDPQTDWVLQRAIK